MPPPQHHYSSISFPPTKGKAKAESKAKAEGKAKGKPKAKPKAGLAVQGLEPVGVLVLVIFILDFFGLQVERNVFECMF